MRVRRRRPTKRTSRSKLGRPLHTRRSRIPGVRTLTDWKDPFLAFLRQCPMIISAADAVGITRSTAYRTRAEDPDFARAWDDAIAEGNDRFESLGREHAIRMLEECDDPRLYMIYLRRVKPEYRDPGAAGAALGLPSGAVVQIYLPDNGRDPALPGPAFVPLALPPGGEEATS